MILVCKGLDVSRNALFLQWRVHHRVLVKIILIVVKFVSILTNFITTIKNIVYEGKYNKMKKNWLTYDENRFYLDGEPFKTESNRVISTEKSDTTLSIKFYCVPLGRK